MTLLCERECDAGMYAACVYALGEPFQGVQVIDKEWGGCTSVGF